jgi:hypothetical protein
LFPRKEVLAMAVPAFLLTIGKVVTSPYTTATLLGANTIMNGVEIKQGEDIKSGISQIKSEQQNEMKLLKQISITTAASLTASDLDDYFSNLAVEENNEAAAPAQGYSKESLDAAYQRGVAEANAKVAADKAAADKAAAEAATQQELTELRAKVAALQLGQAAPATTPTVPNPTQPAPAVTAPATAPATDEAPPAWIGAFTDALAKTVGAEVEKAVKSTLAAAPGPSKDKG